MMRLILLFIGSLFIALSTTAQTTTPVPAKEDTALYLRFPFVPPFNLYKVPDSTLFTKANLKKKKATLLIIFSPDCDHCQQETRELTAAIQLFKKVQIVMATWLPYEQIMQFYKAYNIAFFANITIGWDKAFMLPAYFKMKRLPLAALYDKKGNFICMFEGHTDIKKIAAAFE